MKIDIQKAIAAATSTIDCDPKRLLQSNILDTFNDIQYLNEFKQYSGEEILKQRKEKFLSIGKQKAFTVFSKESKWISRDNFFIFVKKILLKFKKELIITFLLIFFSIFFLF